LFKDDADSWSFLQLLGASCEAHDVHCVAWCLMSNHFHVVLCTVQPGLGEMMRKVLTKYARRFNYRYRRSGHVFQGRYHASLINRDAYLLEVVRYVLLNPVRANLCHSPADWRWSSAREALGLKPTPSWADFSIVYGLLGPMDGRSPHRLLQFLRDGDGRR
jgi:REP element-mobilizing transposase RayT